MSSLLLLVLLANMFFSLVVAFPSLFGSTVESQGRRIEKRDINYSFLTHTGLPEGAAFWMYMAIFALVYLIITACIYTITSIFCRPKKEEYPVLDEKGSSAVAVRSRADNTTSASLDVKIDTQSAGDYSSLTRSTARSDTGRLPSSLLSLSEREAKELRETRNRMKTAKGEFVSARHSKSELQLVEELNAELKSTTKTAKTSKWTPQSSTESKGTTSTSTSEEEETSKTSTSGSSSEKSGEVYEMGDNNADSSKFGSGSESDSNELSKKSE